MEWLTWIVARTVSGQTLERGQFVIGHPSYDRPGRPPKIASQVIWPERGRPPSGTAAGPRRTGRHGMIR
jgi:hypothetical protein